METQGLSHRRRLWNGVMRALILLSAGLTCALLLFLIGYIFYRGLPYVTWELLSTSESVLRGTVGILPSILNTLYVIIVTIAITLPIGVGAAIYLTEYATETLSGIPSIIYAIVGVILFCNYLGLKKTLIAGSLTLSIMNLPTIIRTTQESLKTVPQSYREGALGLGAGKWHSIRTIVLPCSIDGIVTGCILAIGRIVGESAVLMYTVGLSTTMQDFSSWQGLMNSSGATLTVALYVFAKERTDFKVAFAIASILLLLTMVINLTAKLAGRKLKKN